MLCSCTMSVAPIVCAPHIHPGRLVLFSLLRDDNTETEISRGNHHRVTASSCQKGPRSQVRWAPALLHHCTVHPRGCGAHSPHWALGGGRECGKVTASRIQTGPSAIDTGTWSFYWPWITRAALMKSFSIYVPTHWSKFLYFYSHFILFLFSSERLAIANSCKRSANLLFWRENWQSHGKVKTVYKFKLLLRCFNR